VFCRFVFVAWWGHWAASPRFIIGDFENILATSLPVYFGGSFKLSLRRKEKKDVLSLYFYRLFSGF